jgi:hypothetical protein
MGEKETLTVPVQHLPTPSTCNLPFNLHHLVEDDISNLHSAQPVQSPRMSHEAYMSSQYGPVHYPESQHGVGLGIQYVSCSIADHDLSELADLRSTILSTNHKDIIRLIGRILDHL